MGMPPPTLASNRRFTRFCRARSSSSGPNLAIASLLAVTTCLPQERASFRYWAAGSVPPITSTTICMEGSARISAGLVVIKPAGTLESRDLLGSRTRTFFRLTGRPTFLEMPRDCSNKVAATPPPTTPSPNKPTFISCISWIALTFAVYWPPMGNPPCCSCCGCSTRGLVRRTWSATQA